MIFVNLTQQIIKAPDDVDSDVFVTCYSPDVFIDKTSVLL